MKAGQAPGRVLRHKQTGMIVYESEGLIGNTDWEPADGGAPTPLRAIPVPQPPEPIFLVDDEPVLEPMPEVSFEVQGRAAEELAEENALVDAEEAEEAAEDAAAAAPKAPKRK